jgi:hypothetical protein
MLVSIAKRPGKRAHPRRRRNIVDAKMRAKTVIVITTMKPRRQNVARMVHHRQKVVAMTAAMQPPRRLTVRPYRREMTQRRQSMQNRCGYRRENLLLYSIFVTKSRNIQHPKAAVADSRTILVDHRLIVNNSRRQQSTLLPPMSSRRRSFTPLKRKQSMKSVAIVVYLCSKNPNHVSMIVKFIDPPKDIRHSFDTGIAATTIRVHVLISNFAPKPNAPGNDDRANVADFDRQPVKCR